MYFCFNIAIIFLRIIVWKGEKKKENQKNNITIFSPLFRQKLRTDIHHILFLSDLVTLQESGRAVGGLQWCSQGSTRRQVLMEWHSRSADHSSECLPGPVLHASWLRHMLITKHISSMALAPFCCSLFRPPTVVWLTPTLCTQHLQMARWQKARQGAKTPNNGL